MTLDLSDHEPVLGRRILVTGASSGYGQAAALALLKQGARVAGCSRGEEGLRLVENAGGLVAACDVSKPKDVSRLMAAVRKRLGGLDAVVNNAGILLRRGLLEMDEAQWEQTVATNLTGPWLVTRAALDLMPRGCVVNVTSGLGWVPMRPYSAYSVSKAALNMLTRALAEELAATHRVNAVDPGVARTRMNPQATGSPDAVVPVIRALACARPEGPNGLCFKKDGSQTPW